MPRHAIVRHVRCHLGQITWTTLQSRYSDWVKIKATPNHYVFSLCARKNRIRFYVVIYKITAKNMFAETVYIYCTDNNLLKKRNNFLYPRMLTWEFTLENLRYGLYVQRLNIQTPIDFWREFAERCMYYVGPKLRQLWLRGKK